MTPRTSKLVTSIAAAGALASSLLAPPAQACGGFFCDNVQPINQAAERILFAVEDDGSVTATIQILYSGDADSFAWVLPVAGSPEVSVSSNLAFARLQAATNPTYTLTTRVEGTCSAGLLRSAGSESDFSGARSDAGAGADAGASPVTVVNEGSVGPYDFVVISIDTTSEGITDTAVEWLHDNGYQIDEAGAARLEPYLSGGMNLLAFRLTSGNSTGSIRPVQISFGSGLASIPIRPTAVAAVEDMGVMVWVLGRYRAIPVNYMSLELNEALINWLSPAPTYNDVVIAAANQAGGQGFVTELAADADTFEDVVFSEGERGLWTDIASQDWTNREGQLLQRVLGSFGGFDGIRDALAGYPLPDGITLDDLMNCPFCYVTGSETDIEGFDPEAFLAAMETQAIEPMARTAALFGTHPYLTRFYTTMSADEMTRDPAFDFNSNLPDLSNAHTADRIIECSPSINQFEAPWRVELANGETIRGSGNAWPFSVDDGSMPANARIARLETDGDGEIIVDNVAAIATALTDHNRTVPRLREPSGGGLLCSASAANTGIPVLGLFSLAGVALALGRRRAR
jgi:hypothetical protein